MMTLAFYAVVAVTILVLVYVLANKSPTGYEDESGFHAGSEPMPCERCRQRPKIEHIFSGWVVYHECHEWEHYSELRPDYSSREEAVKAWNELFRTQK